ncbi:MAG: glycosyltransferase family 2 protein [Vulcanimicrobiota bacterium]
MYQTSDVSVVVPVYGPPEFFLEALESVVKEQPGEIIVVDDASPRPLPDLSRFPDLKLIRHSSNLGPGAARNTGVRAAGGTWLCFNDADDLWVEGRLKLQLELAERHQVDVVHGRLSFLASDGGPDPLERTDQVSPGMPTYLLRRELALRFPLDESSKFSEDLEFYAQLKDHGVPIHSHPEAVHCYRRHSTSLTAGRPLDDIKADIFRTLSRSLSRRRALAQGESK